MIRNKRAAAVLLATLAMLATACPSSKPARGSQTPSASPTTRGGKIVVAYPNEPATLDPYSRAGDNPATRDLARMLMPSLYRITPEGTRERWLLAAEPVESHGPPFSVTVVLRDDAVWSDGEPITVDDLRFTWKLALRSARAPIARQGYDRIARIVGVSQKSARIEFRSPFRRWRDLFSGGLGVLPAHALSTAKALEKLGEGWPVSGGPFVLKAWHPGLDMIFAPNPHPWFARPLLDEIRVAFVPDDVGALALLRKGTVQVVAAYQAADWIRRVRAVPRATVSVDSGQTWAGVVLNTQAAPLNDVRVRRAFADAIDRTRLVRGLVQDQGSLLNAIPPAGGKAFADFGNLARARSTLTSAGWSGSDVRQKSGNKLMFTLALSDADGLGAVLARAIQYQAARAGFDVEALVLPEGELFTRWLATSRFQAAILSWRDPPEGAARAHFSSRGGDAPNIARISDGSLDDAFDSEDASTRASQSGSEADLARLVPVLPLSTLAVAIVSKAGVQGVRSSAEADGPFWDAQGWAIT